MRKRGAWCRTQEWDPVEAVRDFNELTLKCQLCLWRFLNGLENFDKHDMSLTILTKIFRESPAKNCFSLNFPLREPHFCIICTIGVFDTQRHRLKYAFFRFKYFLRCHAYQTRHDDTRELTKMPFISLVHSKLKRVQSKNVACLFR